MVSPYVQQAAAKARTEAEATEARARRRSLARLRDLAKRLDDRAQDIRCGGFNPAAESQAGDMADDAHAIRWALRQIAPMTEGPAQVLDEIAKVGE